MLNKTTLFFYCKVANHKTPIFGLQDLLNTPFFENLTSKWSNCGELPNCHHIDESLGSSF